MYVIDHTLSHLHWSVLNGTLYSTFILILFFIHFSVHRWARSHRHNGDSRSPLPSLALPESSSEAFTSQPPTIIQHNSEKPKKAPSKTESQEGINNLLPSTPTKGSKKGQKTTVKNISTIFSSPNCTTVMAQTGTTAILHCEVNDIAENTVRHTLQRRYEMALFRLITLKISVHVVVGCYFELIQLRLRRSGVQTKTNLNHSNRTHLKNGNDQVYEPTGLGWSVCWRVVSSNLPFGAKSPLRISL